MKEILSSCSNCRNKISQFVTKKTVHSSERWTQTTYKPFLIDLIEERVDEMYETNSRLSRMLVSREEEIEEKAQ